MHAFVSVQKSSTDTLDDVFNLNLFSIGPYKDNCDFGLTQLDANVFKELRKLKRSDSDSRNWVLLSLVFSAAFPI